MSLISELPYLAGTCEACGVEHATGYLLDRNSDIQTGECGLCERSYCFDCQVPCECCDLKVCRGCTRSCEACWDTCCTRCLVRGNCRFCAEDEYEESLMGEMGLTRQYSRLTNGVWFCLTAAMMGAATGLIWMWIGGGGL